MCFNPRTHEWCDGRVPAVGRRHQVSIHAPTRGATEYLCLQWHNYERFQSTHPRGVRQNGMISANSIRCFNPRTHEGCDLYSLVEIGDDGVSIHAPTRGATSKGFLFTLFFWVSIHAPTRGATRGCCDNFFRS